MSLFLASERESRAQNLDDEIFSREKLTFLEQRAKMVIVRLSSDVTVQTPLEIKRVAAQQAQESQQLGAMKRAKSIVDEMRRRVEQSRLSSNKLSAAKRRPSQYEDLMKAARRYQKVSLEIGSLESAEAKQRGVLIAAQFSEWKLLLTQQIQSLEPRGR